jgi:hypothetical protein
MSVTATGGFGHDVVEAALLPSTKAAAIPTARPKPLLLGGALWVTVGSASLLLQAAHL